MTTPHLAIKTQRDGQVVAVTIDRAEKFNALGVQTFAELFDLIADLRNGSSVRVLMITGAGSKAFCAGADIDDVSGLSPEAFRAFCQNTVEVYRQLRALPQIVVAAVNGLAYGAGCALVMASDIAVADPRARFAQPEIKVGIVGGAALLPRHLSNPSLAREMVLCARSISASEALQNGLVGRVAEERGLSACVEDAIDRLLQQPAGALVLAKQALVRGACVPDAVAAFEIQQDLAAAAFALPERAERMKGFLARSNRAPPGDS